MKYYLRYIRLNMGGYDESGSYWGTGKPLYMYWNDENEVSRRSLMVHRYEPSRD